MGLTDTVRFLGTVPHDEIPAILAEHDVYVQPSIVDRSTRQTESFGVAVLEAIAVGLPVVVSAVGGLPYVVGEPNEFAITVPPEDVEALFEAMVAVFGKVADNFAYAEGRVSKYSSLGQIQSCKDIYHDLLIKPVAKT